AAFAVQGGATPFTVNSATKVAKLNADLLDGVDGSALQARITGTCASGSAVRVLNADGSVACQSIGGAGNGWGLTGNAGTATGSNFLGTTDARDLVVKTHNVEALRVTKDESVGIGTTNPTAKLEASTATGVAVRGLSAGGDAVEGLVGATDGANLSTPDAGH